MLPLGEEEAVDCQDNFSACKKALKCLQEKFKQNEAITQDMVNKLALLENITGYF